VTPSGVPPGFSNPEFEQRLGEVRTRIHELGGDRVRLVAVTKGWGAEVALAAADAGCVRLGESYVQELTAKWDAAELSDTRWHFIGQLQTNKVKFLAGRVELYESIDRPKLARTIARLDPGAQVLIQINLTDDPARGGVGWSEVDDLVETSRELGLDVRGLMTVGVADDPKATQAGFERLVRTADAQGLAVRSFGMSGDWEAAIEAGSTEVRLGTVLFGERQTPRGEVDGLPHG